MTSTSVLEKGAALYRRGAARVIDVDFPAVEVEVVGSSGETRRVILSAKSSWCDCPAVGRDDCSHIIAARYELERFAEGRAS